MNDRTRHPDRPRPHAPSVRWPSLGAGQKGDVGGAPTSSDVECHRLISPAIACYRLISPDTGCHRVPSSAIGGRRPRRWAISRWTTPVDTSDPARSPPPDPAGNEQPQRLLQTRHRPAPPPLPTASAPGRHAQRGRDSAKPSHLGARPPRPPRPPARPGPAHLDHLDAIRARDPARRGTAPREPR